MAELHELSARRAGLLEQADALFEQIRPLAVAAVRDGQPKFYVARDAGVTRRTLDAWVRDAAGPLEA